MMKNDIIEEVWRNRDEFAKQHNYNIDDMVAELQKSEQNPFSRLVDRRELAPNGLHSDVGKARGRTLPTRVRPGEPRGKRVG